MQLEDARLGAIGQNDARALLAVENRGQRLQMEALTDADLRLRQLREARSNSRQNPS